MWPVRQLPLLLFQVGSRERGLEQQSEVSSSKVARTVVKSSNRLEICALDENYDNGKYGHHMLDDDDSIGDIDPKERERKAGNARDMNTGRILRARKEKRSGVDSRIRTERIQRHQSSFGLGSVAERRISGDKCSETSLWLELVGNLGSRLHARL